MTPQRLGNFGRIRHTDPRARAYRLADAAPAPAIVPPRRRWYLRRGDQLDQGPTPHCVAYTGKHWERARPIETRTGLAAAELYRRCKERDGYVGQDGTDAGALMKVYRELGMVESFVWHFAGDDEEAVKLWLLTRGPLWFGAYWTRSMLAPVAGRLTVTGTMAYGHEVALVGYDRARDEWELVNSWGAQWGVMGRARLRGPDFTALVADGGDVVGAVECKPTSAAGRAA